MTEEPPKLEMLNFLKTVPVVHVLHFKHIQINVCVWEDGTVKRAKMRANFFRLKVITYISCYYIYIYICKKNNQVYIHTVYRLVALPAVASINQVSTQIIV
jgi:hypothetical protein